MYMKLKQSARKIYDKPIRQKNENNIKINNTLPLTAFRSESRFNLNKCHF